MIDSGRPTKCFELMLEALSHLEHKSDIRPALSALDRLGMAVEQSVYFSTADVAELRRLRAIVDDDADAAYQGLVDIMDSWAQRWGANPW